MLREHFFIPPPPPQTLTSYLWAQAVLSRQQVRASMQARLSSRSSHHRQQRSIIPGTSQLQDFHPTTHPSAQVQGGLLQDQETQFPSERCISLQEGHAFMVTLWLMPLALKPPGPTTAASGLQPVLSKTN